MKSIKDALVRSPDTIGIDHGSEREPFKFAWLSFVLFLVLIVLPFLV